jgi:xanthine/CO dehydrogenase XdhC/CoxF family maturation factor
MYPVYDIDATLLLSIALTSKRRPAGLLEIVAADELILGTVSAEPALLEAFHRLSVQGLISGGSPGYELTSEAQKMIAALHKKADNEARLMGIKSAFAAFQVKGEHLAVQVSPEELAAAVLAHQEIKLHAGKNLLVAKPKPEVDSKRPGRRKPLPSRRKY